MILPCELEIEDKELRETLEELHKAVETINKCYDKLQFCATLKINGPTNE